MKKNSTPYIYILFFAFFVSNFYGQNSNIFHLKIKSNDTTENRVIKSIDYKKEFKHYKNLLKTKDSVFSFLKTNGFYTLFTETYQQNKDTYSYTINLGNQIKELHVKIDSEDFKLLKALNLSIKNDFLIIKSNTLNTTLNTISNHLAKEGFLFSKVKLIQFKTKNQILFCKLSLEISTKRAVDKIIVKGYRNFPKAFTKHYLNKKKNNAINKTRLNEISENINQLSFASETKKPEILFSKDSTIIYTYLKKEQANKFDGLISFSTEESKINFRGYVNLKLINSLNKGEEIKINWMGNKSKQDFSIHAKIPYLFNSKVSTEASFNLFKNDAVFTNSYSQLKLMYPLTRSIDASVTYHSETSTSNISIDSISSYKKKFAGFGFNYNSFKKEKLTADISVLFGTRESEVKNSQVILNFNLTKRIQVSDNKILFLKNKSAFLFSDTYFTNELFREGGINSIRGFKELTLSTPKFSFITSELRFMQKNESFLYSIQDVGVFSINKENNMLYTLGIGYNYIKNNTSFDISYAYGSTTESANTNNSPLLSIKILSIF
ncbi:MAG: hypothetical protein P8J16_04650 [Polaribacter sp.]|nr:hypothetical protein [Polaribacter sp.]